MLPVIVLACQRYRTACSTRFRLEGASLHGRLDHTDPSGTHRDLRSVASVPDGKITLSPTLTTVTNSSTRQGTTSPVPSHRPTTPTAAAR